MITWRGHATCHHKTYRLDCVTYDALLRRAGGRCEICRKPVADTVDNRLGIDHDHKQGNGMNYVRGMLCTRCNCQLNYVERGVRGATDDEARYLANSWYLSHPPQTPGVKDGSDPVRLPMVIRRDLSDRLDALAELGGTTTAAVLTDFIRWFNREPGAKLPERPSHGGTS